MKNKLYILVLVGLLLAACSYDFDQSAVIALQDKVLIFDGNINQGDIDRIKDLVDGKEVHQVSISSPGGEVIAAMEIAEWIYQNELDVKIIKVCASSCANYIFPAGKRKFIGKDALIFWHGSAFQKSLKPPKDEYRDAFEQYIQNAREKETKLYSDLGVDPRLPILGQEEGYACRENKEFGWFYNIQDLNIMGVNNIVLIDGEWDPMTTHAEEVCQVKL